MIPTSHPQPTCFSTESVRAFYGSLFSRYWKLFAGMAALMGLYAAVTAVRLLLSGVLMDAVLIHFDANPGKFIGRVDRIWSWFCEPGSPLVSERLGDSSFFLQFLIGTLVVFASIAVVMAFAFFLKEYCGALLVALMTVDIRRAFFQHLTRQSVAYFNHQRSGDVISRITNDVQSVQLSLRFFFEDLIQQPLTILGALSVALVASPKLFLVTAPFYVIIMLPVVRSAKKVLKHGRGRLQNLSLVTEAVEQLFSGIRIVKAFGMERHEKDAFQEKNQAFLRSSMKMVRAKTRGRATQELLYNLGTAALLLLGVLAIAFEYVDASGFFIFLLALIQVYNPIKSCSRAWNQIQESRAGVERILEVLREEPLIQDRDGSVDFPGLEREVRFENISFSYKELDPRLVRAVDGQLELPVVRDVSFHVDKGQVVAFVGPSGAGKSTIVDLLARFYDPQGGRIAVDGADIREFRHASYLQAIAVVSQDPFLFNTSIRENIRYGRESATDQEIEEAARIAFAHDFILEQPEGYDTPIGNRGVMLSGGQRQRITIARAVLKRAQILILDEATSSLDSQAEREVQCAIDNLIESCTTFVIAHRLSTIVRADTIFYLENGRILESGRHDELIAKRRRYYELWRSQNPGVVENGVSDAPGG